ncbi:hypothetical protein SAY86_024866 [Trapa natans]|uniref:ZF-HD dimerization-type domain-containing protein n=1 Tax=Trapa natans TaxID=22666 RepID=A0AAN7RIG1_TRANT|nr:hypothetical protein SAY86_024866 [Trapa natans]
MDLTPTPTNATAGTIKDLDLEPDSPTRNQSFGKSFSFSNGVLKRHHHQGPLLPLTPPDGFTYRECLKNHAASLGRHALDGCGEFMPSPAANEADPTSIKCAACGCHRNFHRREPDDVPPSADPRSNQVIEYHPQHRHHPPPPPPPHSPDSASPPPISSSHYGGHQPTHHHYRHHLSTPPPHMLLTLSTAAPPESSHPPPPSSAVAMVSPISRKRFRTKFTQLQKECMFEFAERVGWKLQKQDEDIIREFCDEIGVERGPKNKELISVMDDGNESLRMSGQTN